MFGVDSGLGAAARFINVRVTSTGIHLDQNLPLEPHPPPALPADPPALHRPQLPVAVL